MIPTRERVGRAAQRGVMLLEALISIAIFSIAVLGLIGLQSAAIRNAGEARQRAVAAFYANQIIGQMWSDLANLTSYQHYSGGDAPTTAKCAFSGSASANTEVDDWAKALGQDLNGATAKGMQQISVGAGNLVRVTLCWKNPEDSVYHWFTTVAQIKGALD
jgi:type IV pilus assembly protein PilV